jgi:hypothetical protein
MDSGGSMKINSVQAKGQVKKGLKKYFDGG